MSNTLLNRPYYEMGAYLHKKRLERGLTQTQISLRLGYASAQHVSSFETGRCMPPKQHMARLIKLYGLDEKLLVKLIMTGQQRVIQREFGLLQ